MMDVVAYLGEEISAHPLDLIGRAANPRRDKLYRTKFYNRFLDRHGYVCCPRQINVFEQAKVCDARS